MIQLSDSDMSIVRDIEVIGANDMDRKYSASSTPITDRSIDAFFISLGGVAFDDIAEEELNKLRIKTGVKKRRFRQLIAQYKLGVAPGVGLKATTEKVVWVYHTPKAL